MTETFTEEQVKDLIKKAREEEQWKIAGDTYYRAANVYLEQLVRQGVYDLYVLQVGQALHKAFKDSTVTTTQQEQQIVEEEQKE
jgi:hypothetical protein